MTLVSVALCFALLAFPQATALKVLTIDGGTVVTPLSYNIKVNSRSTLRRTWLVINDPTCPVQISRAGINTAFEQDRVSGSYHFKAAGSFTVKEAVSALTITFILYDPFGDHMKTLGATYVEDFAAEMIGSLDSLGGRWYANETDVRDLLTVVAFISDARTTGGAVWKYNEKAISTELNQIRLKVTSGILEPQKEPKE